LGGFTGGAAFAAFLGPHSENVERAMADDKTKVLEQITDLVLKALGGLLFASIAVCGATAHSSSQSTLSGCTLHMK